MMVLEHFDPLKAKSAASTREQFRRLNAVGSQKFSKSTGRFNPRQSLLKLGVDAGTISEIEESVDGCCSCGQRRRKTIHFLLTASADGHLKAMETGSTRLVADVNVNLPIHCCVETKTGNIVVGFKDTADLRLVRMEDSTVLMVLYGHRCKIGFGPQAVRVGVNQLIVLTDGRVCSAGMDSLVKLWEPEQEEQEKSAPGRNSKTAISGGVSSLTLEAPTDEMWTKLESKRPRPMTLHIHCPRAQGVPKADSWFQGGKADPYVIVRVVDQDPCVSEIPETVFAETASPVKYNTLDPEWNWKGDLQLPAHAKPLYLHVVLLDYDIAGKDDVIGHLAFPLAHALVDNKTGFVGKQAKEFGELHAYPIQKSPASTNNFDLENTKIIMGFHLVMQSLDDGPKAGVKAPIRPKPPSLLPTEYSTIRGATAMAECCTGSQETCYGIWRLLVGYTDGIVCIWDLFAISFGNPQTRNAANAPLFRIQAHDAAVTHIWYMPKAQRAATAGYDQKIKFWQADAHPRDVARLAPTLQLSDTGGWTYDAQELSDGRLAGALHRTTSFLAFWE